MRRSVPGKSLSLPTWWDRMLHLRPISWAYRLRGGPTYPDPIFPVKKNQGPTWLVVDLPLVGNILLMVNMVIIWLMMVNNILVGGWPTPLKIHGLRQLGWWHSQLNGKIKNVPTHQPATNSYQCFNGLLSREKHTPKKKIHFETMANKPWFWAAFGSVSKPCTPGEHQNSW